MAKKQPKKSVLQIITCILKKNQKFLIFVVFIAIIGFRIWLSTGVPKQFIYAPHDDLFYARAAQSLIRGHWMGDYNQYTLIKGPFYAYFLISSFFTGSPLFLNESLFYIGACLVFYFAIKPLISNLWWRLLIFTILLFIPTSLAIWMNLRVYREFVYYSLTLYVISFAIGLILRAENNLRIIIFWSIGLGISMGAFLVTREEGIWIYPILLITLIITMIKIWREKKSKKILRTALLLLPIPIWFIPTLLISYLNYTHYDFWGVSEQLEPEFNRVLNTLARIETEDPWHPAIQISRSARLAAYEASPTLDQFKDTIERSVKGWNKSDNQSMSLKPNWYLNQYGNGGDELGNGHFLWLFRDAVYQKGYYDDGYYPKALFKQIADELEDACKSGELNCKDNNFLPAMVGSIDKRHLPIIFRMFFENIYHTAKLDFFRIASMDLNNWSSWPEGNQEFGVFEQFSYNPIDTIETIRNDELPRTTYGVTDLRYRALIIKENIMRGIDSFYQKILLPLALLAMVNWFVLLFATFWGKNKTKQTDFTIVSFFLLGGFLSRTATLTIVDATSSIPGIAYGQSIQVFLIAFSVIMLVWGAKYLKTDCIQSSTSANE